MIEAEQEAANATAAVRSSAACARIRSAVVRAFPIKARPKNRLARPRPLCSQHRQARGARTTFISVAGVRVPYAPVLGICAHRIVVYLRIVGLRRAVRLDVRSTAPKMTIDTMDTRVGRRPEPQQLRYVGGHRYLWITLRAQS